LSQAASLLLQNLFVSAVRLHQSGRLEEAERLYRQVLATESRHADSLHLLGVIATQRGDHDSAIALIGEAIALNDRMPPFHANLGTSLRAVGRLADAAASYRQALRLKADYPDALNHLGTTLRDLGQQAEAESHYRLALKVKPDYADAHNNLGNLLRETGRPAEAESCYRQALQLMPAFHPKAAAIHCNLGTVLRDLERLPEAEASYQRALRLRPDDEAAHNSRGTALHDMDYDADARVSYRRALALAPHDYDIYNNLGATMRSMGRVAEAETLCRRAVQIAPDFAEAHNALGAILHDLGRLDAARLQMQQALDLAPQRLTFHLSLAVTKRYQADDPHLVQLQALLQSGAARPDKEQLCLHFALAKAYEDIGEKDRSFAHLLVGNRLKRQQSPYDEPATLALLARIKAVFSAELLRELAPDPAPAGGPIFIVGMMRSGSTLVEQILASHPQVWGAGELSLLRQAITEVLGSGAYPEAVAGSPPSELARLGSHYRAALRAEQPNAARITDKFLHNFLYCGLIRMVLPDARIIHTSRDPVDTCLSCFSKLFAGNQPFAYDLAELGRYWRAYDGLMRHWRQVLAPDFMLDVHYEEVVDDLEGQARRILAHCGLPWDDACLDFHKTDRAVRTASALQVRQPIYRSSVGRWRPPPALLAPLTEALSA
jgi:Flp pilus assembly protein TadD